VRPTSIDIYKRTKLSHLGISKDSDFSNPSRPLAEIIMARDSSVMDSQDVIEYSNSEVKTIGNDLELKPTTNTDAARLAELGFSDELKRDFSLPALMGLCLCLMGTWEATSAVVAQALQSGGPPCLWYNL
jgi:hypothetical protein